MELSNNLESCDEDGEKEEVRRQTLEGTHQWEVGEEEEYKGGTGIDSEKGQNFVQF